MKEIRTVRLLLPLVKSRRGAFGLAILLGTLSSLAEGIGISLFAPLLESLNPANHSAPAPGWIQSLITLGAQWLPGNRLLTIVAAILAMTVCKALLMFADSALSASINSRITHAIRSRTFSKLLGLSPAALDRAEPGRLINLLATDTWRASDAIGLFISFVINLCSIAVFSALLLALSWRLTCVVAVGAALVSLLLQSISASAGELGRQAVDANARMSEQMLDGLDGVKVIQMFGLRKYRQALFDAASDKVRSIYFRLDLLHRAIHPVSEVLYVGLLLGILLTGVSLHNSIPTVVIFLLLLYRLQPQIRQLDSARLSLVALAGSVEDLLGFLNAEGELRPATRVPSRAGFTREICFEGVTFFYEPGDDFSLNSISLRIPCGKTTAIVGPSGSGKTTLVNLLCRFRDPLIGRIRIDGQPLSDIDIDEWRGQIAWAGQDTYLFSATVRENIRYGNLEASDEEVVQAAIRADVDEFIRRLPQGYDTKVGNSGVALSGGQAQRIALARAFLRRPAILILDEATSAVDSISEECIQRYLQQGARQQTVIVIAHRLSTVRYADQVYVLTNGRITEEGSPSELFARCGFFSKLRELQNVG